MKTYYKARFIGLLVLAVAFLSFLYFAHSRTVYESTTGPNYYEATDEVDFEWLEIAPPEGGSGSELECLTCWDDACEMIDIGFDFVFFGNRYAEVNVSTNGFLTFGSCCECELLRSRDNGGDCTGYDCNDHANQCIPDSDCPNALIAPFWDDLDLEGDANDACAVCPDPPESILNAVAQRDFVKDVKNKKLKRKRGKARKVDRLKQAKRKMRAPLTEGTIYYQMLGSVPNRRLVVEWYKVPHIDDPCSRLTFQAILYEESGCIKFQYKDMLNGEVLNAKIEVFRRNGGNEYADGHSATIGIESAGGNRGLQWFCGQGGAPPSSLISADRSRGNGAGPIPIGENVNYAILFCPKTRPDDPCFDIDTDGICMAEEDDCDRDPQSGADSGQCWITSFRAKDAAGNDHCITLEMPVTQGPVQVCFQGVQDRQGLIPPPPAPPSWVNQPFGLFTFKIVNLGAGNCTTVTVHWDKEDCESCGGPLDPAPQTYWKFGPTPDNPRPHWYDFSYNGRTGAKFIDENTMVLHFCDGERGDGDLTVNGVIDDPGGLAHIAERPILYFPYLTNLGGGFNADDPAFVGEDTTKLEMVNKSPYPVTGAITFYEADGTVAIDTKLIPSSPTNPFPETLTIGGVQPITIPGNGKLTLMPAEVPSNAVSAIVSADGDVVGYAGFRSGDGKRYAAPGSTTLTSIMTTPAVVANIDAVTGEGWKSGFGILNPGATAVTVEFQDDDVTGAPGDISLDPKASQFFWIEDASAEGFRTMVATGGTIVAIEVFEYVSSTSDVDSAAFLLGNQNFPELCVPTILFGSGQFTSTGLGNPAAAAAMVSVSGFDAALAETVVSLGTVPALGATGANLTTTLAADTLWAKIGADSVNLQGLGAYAENPAGSGPGTEEVATVSLNGLMFKDGCFGVAPSSSVSPIFAMVNPGTVAADVMAFAYDATGALVASSADAVTIAGKTTFGLTDLFGAASLTGAVSIRVVSVESQEQLCGLQLIPVDGRWQGLPILK